MQPDSDTAGTFENETLISLRCVNGSVGDVAVPEPLIQSSAVRTRLGEVFSVTLEPPDS